MAIDKLAEQITGDPQFFWLSGILPAASHLTRKERMHGMGESCVGGSCGANISVARFVNCLIFFPHSKGLNDQTAFQAIRLDFFVISHWNLHV